MIRRSLAFSFFEKYAAILMNLATMAIVSRLMTPAEVGLFMVASALILLVETFRDFGIVPLIVQARELTPELVRTGFTVMAVLTAVLAVALVVGADAFAALYGEPALAPMLRIAALPFILAPFANPIIALLERDMAFDAVARIRVSAAFANSSVLVALAMLGVGPIAFIWASVVAAVVTAAGAFATRPQLSIYRITFAEWRYVLPFGAWASLVTLLNMLFDFVPRLILGRALSFSAVGLYTRATTLCQLPERALMTALQPVLLAAMSAEVRQGGRLERAYLAGVANLSVVQWPPLVCLALLADPIVRVLLGQQWLEVVPLVRILAVAALSLFAVHLSYPVLVALGRMRDVVKISLLTLPASVAIVFAASRIGLEAVAWSAFLTGPLQAAVAFYVIRSRVYFAWRDVGRCVAQSAAVTTCTAAPILAVVPLAGGTLAFSVPQAALAGLGAAAGWVAGLHLARHPLAPEVRATARRLLALRPRPRLVPR